VAIFKQHKPGQQHEHREALPRWGVALILAGLAVWLFGSRVTAAMGVSSASEGHAAHAAAASAIWGVRAVLLLAGGAIGWLLHSRIDGAIRLFFGAFNRAFDRISNAYGALVGRLLRVSAVILLLYVGLIGMTYLGFASVPVGFIPEQDKGYMVVNAMLPEGASLDRTEEVLQRVASIVNQTPGVGHIISVPGYNVLNSTNASNAGGMFVILTPFDERKHHPSCTFERIMERLDESLAKIEEAQIVVFGAPPVDGLGAPADSSSRFKTAKALDPKPSKTPRSRSSNTPRCNPA